VKHGPYKPHIQYIQHSHLV